MLIHSMPLAARYLAATLVCVLGVAATLLYRALSRPVADEHRLPDETEPVVGGRSDQPALHLVPTHTDHGFYVRAPGRCWTTDSEQTAS